MEKRNFRIAFAMVLVSVLSACQSQPVYEVERNQQQVASNPVPELHYNVPPQVVYRIDDHRFVTLENYNHCLGYAWYNDTRQGIRTRLGLMWPTGFRGGVINGDPGGMNLVFPVVSRNVCGDRGCVDYMAYSTDGGRSFSWVRYDEDDISFDPIESSRRYAMAVGSDRLYVIEKDRNGTDAYVVQYPMLSGINLSKPYPDGIRGASFRAFSRPGFLAGIRTPSGVDRYTCDETIHDPNASE